MGAKSAVVEGTDTRARLLDAAFRLMWSGSFHASGVDDICRLADVRKGSFYHFFPSKTDLAVEAVRMGWAAVKETVFEPIFQGERRGLDRLRALGEAIDRFQRDQFAVDGVYLGCAFGGLGQEMAHQDVSLRAAMDEIFEEHVDYFERALLEAVDAGEARPGDIRATARSLFAFMEGGLLVAKVRSRPEHLTDVVQLLPALASGSPSPAGR